MAAVLILAATFFQGFQAAVLVPAADLAQTSFKPGRLTCGGRFRLRGHLSDELRRGICIWSWSGGCLDDTPPSDDVIPLFVQAHLLGRGPGPLSSRSGGVVCGGGLSDTLGRLLCNDRLRFFPLNTVPVVHRVVFLTATALTLLPRGTAPTGKVEAPTHDARRHVSAVTLRVTKAMAALSLERVFGST